jgi:isopentenyl-diphosphate delta-isomerase
MIMDERSIKDKQIEICLNEEVEDQKGNGFDLFKLDYQIPDFSFDEIDTSIELLGKRMNLPLIIAPLTGGGYRSLEINKRLAEAAEIMRIGMAVGSQRLMIKYPELKSTYYVRDVAPSILLFGNLGLIHLNYGIGYDECMYAVEEIGADGLMLYVNPLQEVFQGSGMVNFGGILRKLERLCERFPYPIVIKEIGYGMPRDFLLKVKELAVWGIDVAGRGGTNWVKIECLLWSKKGPEGLEEIGIPTAMALKEAFEVLKGKVLFASGGIRKGIEMAKAIALGAKAVSMGLPFLRWASQGLEAILKGVETLREELRFWMWYTGSKDLNALQGKAKEKV